MGLAALKKVDEEETAKITVTYACLIMLLTNRDSNLDPVQQRQTETKEKNVDNRCRLDRLAAQETLLDVKSNEIQIRF